MVAFHHPPPIRPVRYLLSIGRCVVDVWSTQGGTETHCNTTALNLDLARSDRLKARQTRPMAAEHERRGRGTGCPEVTLLSAEHLNPGSWSALLVPNPLSIVHTAMYDKSQSSMWYVCYTYVGYCVDERGIQDFVLIIRIQFPQKTLLPQHAGQETRTENGTGGWIAVVRVSSAAKRECLLPQTASRMLFRVSQVMVDSKIALPRGALTATSGPPLSIK